jgi:hypothetical protein
MYTGKIQPSFLMDWAALMDIVNLMGRIELVMIVERKERQIRTGV